MKLCLSVVLSVAVMATSVVGGADPDDDRARELRHRQLALIEKQKQLLQLGEELVRTLDELERATQALRQLEFAQKKYHPEREKALFAADRLRTELTMETRREAAKRLVAELKREIDAQRPNRGGTIQFGDRVIVVPPTDGAAGPTENRPGAIK